MMDLAEDQRTPVPRMVRRLGLRLAQAP
jgi:hypothetical protein